MGVYLLEECEGNFKKYHQLISSQLTVNGKNEVCCEKNSRFPIVLLVDVHIEHRAHLFACL